MPPPSTSYQSRLSNSEYDPESLSDGEEDAVTREGEGEGESSVVLGFADGRMDKEEERLDWKISRVGGEPTFPPFLYTTPSLSSRNCNLCTLPMALITQMYCPFPESELERVVYAFACKEKECRGKEGSLRVWRANVEWVEEEAEREEEEVEEKKVESKGLGSLIFGGPAIASSSSTNPFATIPKSNPFASSSNPFGTSSPFASTSSFSSTPTPTPPVPSKPKSSRPPATRPSWPSLSHSFPAQYLSTSYEDTSSLSRPDKKLLKKLKEVEGDLFSLSLSDDHHRKEGKGSGGRVKKGAVEKKKVAGGGGGGGGGGEWQGEAYEVQQVRGVDDHFLRFQARVNLEGTQSVRYDPGGVPLPFSSQSPLSSPVPKCPTCRAERRFEYQLMPYLISALQAGEELEWATVGVWSCGEECTEGGEAWKEEWSCLEREE